MTELSANAATPAFQITATDRHHGTVDQRTLDEWELHQARMALALLKEALGREAIVKLLEPEIAAADERARQIAAESNGKWLPVESVLDVRGLTIEQFFDWFNTHFSETPVMLAANPDHYEISLADGIVTETLGGIPTRFQIQPGHVALPENFTPDPTFPVHPTEIVGVQVGQGAVLSTLLDGTTPVILQPSLLQLRETEDGFAIKLTLYFPATAPPEMFEDHCRHYAIEFSRWITMAYEAGRPA
jgi:hypothetical protein